MQANKIIPLLAACIAVIPVASVSKLTTRGETMPVASASMAVEEDVAFVVNKSNPVDNVALTELRNIFLAERAHWPNGQKITIVMRSQGQPERQAVLRAIYRMNESDFSRYFLQSTFTGQTQAAPKLLDSSAGTRRFIFNVPGAIGYVRASELDGSVKALRVDGRAPGENGYRIKLVGR